MGIMSFYKGDRKYEKTFKSFIWSYDWRNVN